MTQPTTETSPWWRTIAPEDFRTRVHGMTRDERAALHAEMDAAIDADSAVLNEAIRKRGPLADARRKHATLGALNAATAFDAQGKPMGLVSDGKAKAKP